MRALRWFTLGMLAGAMLGLVLWASIYVSPWRQTLYLRVDPKMVAVKEKLAQINRQLSENEANLAAGGFAADSLARKQAEQERLWKEHKSWRLRLGQLATAHAKTTPDSFIAWTQSLAVIALPGALIISLGAGLLALFLVLRMQEKQPTIKPVPRRALDPEAKGEALDQFQEAVRRIADIQARSPVRQKARQVAATHQPTLQASEPPTEPVIPVQPLAVQSAHMPPITAQPVSAQSVPAQPILARPQPGHPPLNHPLAPIETAPAPALNTSDTTYLDVLSGWDDKEQKAQDSLPENLKEALKPAWSNPEAVLPQANPELLAMQDEDAAEALHADPYAIDLNGANSDGATDPAWESGMGRMPETTEFEKFDRKKEEVFKLTRKGLTSSEISRRVQLSQDQVELIIRMRRERGGLV